MKVLQQLSTVSTSTCITDSVFSVFSTEVRQKFLTKDETRQDSSSYNSIVEKHLVVMITGGWLQTDFPSRQV